MSNHIRDKSTRKEAIWRQQTLLAAFTSSGAKQRINTAAGTVVEEIVNAIKHFADPKEEEAIKIAVKRIVKLAAETWRFARLEREMITAIMPAPQDKDHDYTGPEYWPPYRPEGTPIASLAGTAPPSDERPKLLLRLFPVIYREPKHESLRNPDAERPDEGCVYHHGLALYDDAEPIMQRAEELKAAGLPPLATASPTAADFPPPLVPSPRNPPPPTPDVEKEFSESQSPPSDAAETAREASVRSKSPPLETTGGVDTTSIRSKTPPPEASDKASVRSKSPRLEVTESASIRSKSPQPEEVEKASIRSATPPPMPPVESFQEPPSPSLAPSEPAQDGYTRPPPGPIDFNTPRDVPSPPPPVETANVPPSEQGEPEHTPSEHAPSTPSNAPPLPAPTESTVLPPPSPPPPAPPSAAQGDDPVPVIDPAPAADPAPTVEQPAPAPPSSPPAPVSDTPEAVPPLPAPTESAIIPPFLPPSTAPSRGLPTPPRSRAATPPRPVSPLFAALDEIDALSSHRSRATSASRRSARVRTSDEDLRKDRPDTTRRTSGYSLSNRSSSQATDWTARTSNSRYMCESRSAAIKGLYPNSPLAGASGSGNLSRTNSLRRKEKRESGVGEAGTWDTDSRMTSVEGNGDPSTHS